MIDKYGTTIPFATLKAAINKASDDLGDAFVAPANGMTIAQAEHVARNVHAAARNIAKIRELLNSMA